MRIVELREKLQASKIEGRERPWGYKWLQRGPSIYITWFLIKTPIKPNTISAFNLLVGLAAVYSVTQLNFWWQLAGILLLYLNLLLDKVDGEVARYKNIYSLRGVYLDEINHYAIPPLFFLGLGWSLAHVSTVFSDHIILLTAAIAALGSIWLRLSHNLKYHIYFKKYRGQERLFADPFGGPTSEVEGLGVDTATIKKQYPIFRNILWFFHQFQDQLWVVIVLLAGLLYEYFLMPDAFFHSVLSWMLIGFAALYVLIFVENIIKGLLSIEKSVSALQ